MFPAWFSLFFLLETANAPEPPPVPTTCPPAAQIRRKLGVKRPDALVACRVQDNETILAAIVPPHDKVLAHVIVLAPGIWGRTRRGETDLVESASWRLPAQVDAWKINVGPANLRGADWLRVDVTASAGQDLFVAQSVVSFFRADGRKVRHLWTGPGDRHETRFDACQLDTVAGFELLDNGALVRTRRTTPAFTDQKGLAQDLLAEQRAACIASPPTRDTFTVADDGVDADVPISHKLRARARQNRLLSLRARNSPEALGQFITNSRALLPLVEREAMDAGSGVTITTSGALAYMMDSSGGSGLNWANIVSIAGPREQPLASALAALRSDDGIWVEQRTDYGGCHRPELATEALRQLVAAWNAAALPVREAFQPLLATDLQEMSGDTCICVRPTEVGELQRALDRNAAIIEGLPGGAEAARALRAIPSQDSVHFDCSPG